MKKVIDSCKKSCRRQIFGQKKVKLSEDQIGIFDDVERNKQNSALYLLNARGPNI